MPAIWKKYVGMQHDEGCHVVVERYEGDKRTGFYPLPSYLNVVNHSPTGFAWGYGGSGPAQLSLAILIEHFSMTLNPEEAERQALALHQDFKWAKIAGINSRSNFVLTSREVDGVLSNLSSQAQRSALS